MLDRLFAGFGARHVRRGDIVYWDGGTTTVLCESPEGHAYWRPLADVSSNIEYGTPGEVK
ncbi:MAG TPA: hypothetical protein VK493_12075 [Bryobacteraceae bacterium]|nr:hypothetical protein [Bryobacteraceae bacterium]